MKSVVSISIFLLCCSLPLVWGAKILGVFPVPGRSHYILGSTLMRALAERGHDVTVISPFGEMKPPKNGSYRDIVLTGFVEEMEEKRKEMNFFDTASMPSFMMLPFITTMMINATEKSLVHPNIQKLIHSGETFDVVIVEQFFNDGHKVLAAHFKAPIIAFVPSQMSPQIGAMMGSPLPPSYVSEIFLSYTPPLTFFQRLCNSLSRVLGDLLFNLWIQPSHNKIAKKHIPNAPDLDDVLYNISLVLVNSHPSLTEPVPLVPNIVEIGGYHVKPAGKLPADLQKFLDEAKEGVIYFSMGSNLRSQDLPSSKRDALLKVFGGLKQKVLWKWESDELPGKPANVRLGKWLPQQEILAHPNVKVFITHGGLLSTTETVYHGVPILAIPIYGDQAMNARNSLRNGIGLILEYADLTEDNLRNKLQELLQNPKYGNNAKSRSKLFHDRQVKPMDAAIYWVEYVIRHKGAPHLRVAGVDLPWYKYFLLDIIGFVALTGVILSYIGLCVARRICKKIRSRCKKNKTEKVKKN